MDYENAIEAFQKSADLYEGENSTSSANGCLLKVAQYSAQLERYDKAIEIFEKVAKASVDNNLLKWSVKDYFLKAGLCYLCKVSLFLFNAFLFSTFKFQTTNRILLLQKRLLKNFKK